MLRRLITDLKGRYARDAWRAPERDTVLQRVRSPNAPMDAHMDGDSRTLLIAFGGMVGGFGIPFFEFSKLTASFPVKRLFVRDLRQAWYHRGMPGHGDSLGDVASALAELVRPEQLDRLVVTGNSAGGYAALLFGTLLGADVVLGFSPQTVIDPAVLAAMDDHRWDQHIRVALSAGPFDERWTDLRAALPAARHADTRYQIYFGQGDRFDRAHAERLIGIDGVRLYRMGELQHFVVTKMRSSGSLERVLREALRTLPAASADAGDGLPQAQSRAV